MRSAPPRLVLPGALRRALAERARASYPREACGLLLGRADAAATTVVELHAGVNLARDAHARFELDPGDHLAAERRAAALGLAVVGAWHSHPDRAARPSEEDRAAALAGWCQVIVAVTAAGAGELRAWRPGGRGLDEMELVERAAE